MKICIYLYDQSAKCTDKLKPLHLIHNQVVEGDPGKLAMRIFETGLNVMLYRVPEDVTVYDMLMFVDTKRFQQR